MTRPPENVRIFSARKLWTLVLWLACLMPASIATGANCGEFCGDNTDCTGLCAYCDSGAQCADCCDLPDQDSCDLNPGCTWSAPNCQNGSNACGAVAEVPRPFKYYFFGGLFFISIVGLGYFAGRRPGRSENGKS